MHDELKKLVERQAARDAALINLLQRAADSVKMSEIEFRKELDKRIATIAKQMEVSEDEIRRSLGL